MSAPARSHNALLRLACAALLAFGLAWCAAARAQDVLPVPPLSDRVIDQTGTLSPAQRSALVDKLATLERELGTQLVILIVPTTQPEDIAAYAQRVADQWKIGRREVGDGLLLVVAKNDRGVRIEVAKTLEGAVPDLAARQIIDRAIVPAFRAGDFAGGLNQAIDQLAARVRGEALPLPGAGAARKPAHQGGIDLQDLALFFFIGVPIAGAVLTGMLGRKLGSVATGVVAGGLGWLFSASVLIAAAAGVLALFLVGVLGFGAARRAGRGGMGGLPPIVIGGGGWGGGGGGGGGGFSSGGGGDFGGGGASGNW